MASPSCRIACINSAVALAAVSTRSAELLLSAVTALACCSEYWRCGAVDNSMSIDAGSWILISTMPDSRASSGILATLNRESPNSSAIWTLVRPSR